jgi:hypothetical protein
MMIIVVMNHPSTLLHPKQYSTTSDVSRPRNHLFISLSALALDSCSFFHSVIAEKNTASLKFLEANAWMKADESMGKHMLDVGTPDSVLGGGVTERDIAQLEPGHSQYRVKFTSIIVQCPTFVMVLGEEWWQGVAVKKGSTS